MSARRALEGLIDPPIPYQHPVEIVEFLDYLSAQAQPPRSILEIGVWEGGTLRLFGECFPDALRVGVDPDAYPIAYEQGAEIVRGLSQDWKVQDAVRTIREQWDLVFIDGAHDEDNTMRDLEFAVTLAPRWIALHDITCRTHPELDTWKVWDAVVKYAPRLGRETVEFKHGDDWWGIGLIVMPEPD